MSVNIKRDKEKTQPIHVFVRARPLNKQELETRSSSCIEVLNAKEIAVKQQYGKRYTFDKVFDSYAKQIDVYKNVVKPLIPEVIAGYNCTVFAYGQTGTGKTYTMAGGSASLDVSWQSDVEAGIIPRAMAHLFDELCLSPQQYTVRVSYLELYNEELFDLLSDNLESKSIRLFEDQHQKGSVIINGISTETVYNKNEVYSILQKGQDRRRTASTLLNAQSSRSHTVFMIMVHTCETTLEGEELVKTGKLNLVDLAGSENISRSGAVDRRAREAGNINQSLLTLGRVIKALVEKSAHIPYRESKLTRILQDSLGGRTKTSIIATISPAASCLEETLSTLDYASRAKHITNRPEVNQRVCQKAWKAQYEKEMDKLRKDLNAARSANGIYLDPENYEQILAANENFKEELMEKSSLVRDLELQLRNLEEEKENKEAEWAQIMLSFEDTRQELLRTRELLEKTDQDRQEQEHLANCFETKAETLHDQAHHLLSITETTAIKYQQKIKVLCSISQTNNGLTNQMAEQVLSTCGEIANNLMNFMFKLKNTNKYLHDTVRDLDDKQVNDLQLMTDLEKRMSSEVKQFINDASANVENALNQDFTRHQMFFNSIISKLEEINDMSKWIDIKINIENARRETKLEISRVQNNVQKQREFNEEILTSIEALEGQLNNIKQRVLQSTAMTPTYMEAINNIQECTETLLQTQNIQDNVDYSTATVRKMLETIDNFKNQENVTANVLEQFRNFKAIVEPIQTDDTTEPNQPLEVHIQNIVDIANVCKNYNEDAFSAYTSSNNKILEKLSNLRSYSLEQESSMSSNLQHCQDDLRKFIIDGVQHLSPSGVSPIRVSRDTIVEPSPRQRILSRFRNKMENLPNKILEFDEDSTNMSSDSENGQIPVMIDNRNIANIQHEECTERKKIEKNGKENREH